MRWVSSKFLVEISLETSKVPSFFFFWRQLSYKALLRWHGQDNSNCSHFSVGSELLLTFNEQWRDSPRPVRIGWPLILGHPLCLCFMRGRRCFLLSAGCRPQKGEARSTKHFSLYGKRVWSSEVGKKKFLKPTPWVEMKSVTVSFHPKPEVRFKGPPEALERLSEDQGAVHVLTGPPGKWAQQQWLQKRNSNASLPVHSAQGYCANTLPAMVWRWLL